MEREIFLTYNNNTFYYDQIFLESEEPELFTVIDLVGQNYLIMLLNDAPREWMSMVISLKRLKEIKCGVITIKHAFLNAELKKVDIIIENDNKVSIDEISADNIPEKYLPLDYVRLNWDNRENFMENSDIMELARKDYRDVLEIRAISKDTENHTMDLGSLGGLITNFNNVYKSIAKRIILKNNMKECKYQDEYSLRFVNCKAGSFCIQLEGSTEGDMFGVSKITNAFENMFDLLNYNIEEDISGNELKKWDLDIIKNYRKFLKYIRDDMELEFKSATYIGDNSKYAYWRKGFAQKTLESLNNLMEESSYSVKYTGTLVAIRKRNNSNATFEFLTDDETLIKGSISPDIAKQIFMVEGRYNVELNVSISINRANETEEKYVLVRAQNLENM